ncbi:MAG: FecR domain-containing protein [Bacteroidales bacterium]|nr:FecR domain-containing protein [Bacteroidales bacterium]MDD4031236.1 FecR domain-containing protein [Bacteroidales bacterium]MDD4435754.1 FecR domain-containing protein [Bacteroidales bacterium]MDD5732850.1 FecR domain-containing protein [Bacteroidales bacterium]
MKSPISMIPDQEKIKELAISYYEGKIHLKDESLLFDFVSQSKENKSLFRKWEQEWLREHKPSQETLILWDRLSTGYRCRKKQLLDSPIVRKNILSRRIFQAVAAAAVFAVVFLAIELGRQSGQDGGYAFVIETQNAEQSKVILPDGTVVYLNAATKLRCPERFNQKHRTMELEGEAYFEVARNEDMPFIVKAKNIPIKVLGTRFNVTAYADEPSVTTALLEGRLELGGGDKKITMLPDDIIRFDVNTSTVSKFRQNASQYISWTERRFEYNMITFDELFKRLSRQYDVNIIFTAEKKMDKIFNISLNNGETITDVLDALSLIIPFTTRRDGKNLYITFK